MSKLEVFWIILMYLFLYNREKKLDIAIKEYPWDTKLLYEAAFVQLFILILWIYVLYNLL